MAENGVDSAGLREAEQPTTMAIVSVNGSGERDFRFVRGADKSLASEEVDVRAIAGSKVLHFGSVSLTPRPVREATLFAARSAKDVHLLVSYAPNYRAALWDSQENAVEWMRIPLPLVDILKLSEEELSLIAVSSGLEAGTRLLEEQGIKLIMVTWAETGCSAAGRDKVGISPASR